MTENRPEWMNDPLVHDIPKEKLDFLEKMFVKGHGKNQKELMSQLLPMLKKAKEQNLTFTPSEMKVAIDAIKKYSSKEELQKIDHLLNKVKDKT